MNERDFRDDPEYDNILKFIKRGRSGGGAYFQDGVRKVHYVLVLTITKVYRNFETITYYIRNLEKMGLDFEQSLGIQVPVIFIKIHISDEVSNLYKEIYDIEKSYADNFDYSYNPRDRSSSFKTPAHFMNVFKGVNFESLFLTKVRIIHQMLKLARFGNEIEMHGIRRLENMGIFQDHYPLHDGTIQWEFWHNNDLLNDRTLLAKYWANYSIWYKEQPIDLINKYYGSEVAFYFAWVDFYIKMLAPIAIIGTLFSIISVADVMTKESELVNNICQSEVRVCGLCMKSMGCEMSELSSFCVDYTLVFFLQHYLLFIYALCIPIWGVVFLKMWIRKQFILKVRWNLLEVDYTGGFHHIRSEYIENSRKSWKNGKLYYTVDRRQKIMRKSISILLYLGSLLFIVGFIYGKQFSYLLVKATLLEKGFKFDTGVFMTEMHSYVHAVFTIIYSRFVVTMAYSINKIYLPKTRAGSENLILFVTFSLDFFNNYFPLLHTAFLKNLSYNVPEERGPFLLQYDSCEPFPCLLILFVQIMVLMTLKTIFEKIFVICWPKIKKCLKNYLKEQLKTSPMPQYEEEYYLASSGISLLDNHFSQKAIQYGMVVAFIYSFPLAPLCALIHNILDLRMEAKDLVYKERRPVSNRKRDGIGIWSHIIQHISLFGAFINVFVMSFVGDFIDFLINRITHKTYSTYQQQAFTEYSPYAVFGKNNDLPNLPDKCYFRGDYARIENTGEYARTKVYWESLFAKLFAVLLFETFITIITTCLRIIIPAIPFNVQKKIYIDRTNLNNKYNRRFNDKLELRPDEDVELKLRKDMYSLIPQQSVTKRLNDTTL